MLETTFASIDRIKEKAQAIQQKISDTLGPEENDSQSLWDANFEDGDENIIRQKNMVPRFALSSHSSPSLQDRVQKVQEDFLKSF